MIPVIMAGQQSTSHWRREPDMRRLKLAIVLLVVLVFAVGAHQIQTDSAHASNCPSGGGCGCGTAYAPVICKGHCRYVNMCHASCAGFNSSQCKDALN